MRESSNITVILCDMVRVLKYNILTYGAIWGHLPKKTHGNNVSWGIMGPNP